MLRLENVLIENGVEADKFGGIFYIKVASLMLLFGGRILPSRRSIKLKVSQYWLAAFFMIVNLPPVQAKDMQVLIRVLDAAFSAEQMSTICVSADIKLSDDDKDVFKSATIYSRGIKRHVMAGLNASDADFVLKSAAGLAKAFTQTEISALAEFPPAQLPDETLRWCTNKVKPFALQTVGVYMRNPEVIEHLIAKAKAD